MYQLIAFDINGTLLTSKKQLQKAALKQLRELKMLVNKLYFQQDVLCQK
jgi:hydroxymethylpyrimidine pyrophosphatase-like HAD family hydrolase